MPDIVRRNRDKEQLINTLSGLATLLQTEIRQRGWSLRDLAQRADMPVPTLSKIINNPDQIPHLRTLATLAQTLELPLARLIAACGFDVSGYDDPDDHAARIATIVAAVPHFQEFFGTLASCSPEEQASVLTYIDLLRQRLKGIG